MPFRFRYVKPGGEEVVVESLDGLRDHIRSGSLGEETLLHDALTGEWAPARAHAVYELLNDPGIDLPPEGGSPSVDDAPVALGLQDLPEPAVELPELPAHAADSRAFIEDLLRERAAEDERRGDSDLVRGNSHATLMSWDRTTEEVSESHENVAPAGGEAAPPETTAPPAPPRRSYATSPARHHLPPRPPEARTSPGPGSEPRTGRLWPEAGGRWRTPVAAGVILLVGALLLNDRQDAPAEGSGVPQAASLAVPAAASPAPGADVRGVLVRLAATEGEAFADMVGAMDSLRSAYRIERVPPVWLEGRYLADAGSFPEVESYWVRYRDFIRDVRQSDTALFRQSLVGRLREQGVSGPMIPIRLASALEGFRASQPEREVVYAHMEDLGTTALELHELLVRHADEIEYDPVTRTRASREPVLQAYAGDHALRESMWALMDRIFDDLGYLHDGTPLSRETLGEQLLEGIRATGGIQGGS